MTIALLELAAVVLGPLVDEVVFVGGATLEVHTTDPAAPPARPTEDVDVVVEAATRGEYERFAERLRARGLGEDSTSRVICRWRHPDSPIVLDVMPTEGRVFGFANRWYPDVVRAPMTISLPTGAQISIVRPALLLATKLDAFADRGASDTIASRDLADIVTLLDRRLELLDDVVAESDEVREFIADWMRRLLARDDIDALIAMQLLPDAASQARAQLIVRPRMEQLAIAAQRPS